MKKVITSTTELQPKTITVEIIGNNEFLGENAIRISSDGFGPEYYNVASNRGVAEALLDFLEGINE